MEEGLGDLFDIERETCNGYHAEMDMVSFSDRQNFDMYFFSFWFKSLWNPKMVTANLTTIGTYFEQQESGDICSHYDIFEGIILNITGYYYCGEQTLLLSGHYSERDGVSIHRRFHCLLNCCSGADLKKQQSSVSLAFVRYIHRWIPCTKDQ